MGYWDCEYCGSTDIAGSELSCPNCGKGRGKNVVFHPNPRGGSNKPRHYISENTEEYHRATVGPDWVCSFCDSNNRADHPICRNCGHSKDESDRHYFELHPERKNQIVPPSETDDNYHSPKRPETSSDDDENPQDDDNDHHQKTSHYLPSSYSTSRSSVGPILRDALSYIPWGKVCAALLIVAFIFGMVYLFVPKERYITVTDVDWQRSITIEEYRTVRESDWSVPAGGRTVYTQEEIHHYNHVLDHYDTVTKSRQVITGSHYEPVTKSRQVITGSHEVTVGYRDLGNGYFEEITQTVYDYGTEYYTEQQLVYDYGTEYYTEEEPVYVNVPEYHTKYYYDIERWVYDHTETSSAHDHEPYWPEVKMESNQRMNGRSESYGLTATYKDKEDHYTLDYSDWCELNVGSQLHVKVHFGGRIEILPDE